MYLIVGLGNPGEKYEGTRHNVGRAIVEAFGKKTGGLFVLNKKWGALAAESKLGKAKFTLLMPETFMNKSGNAIGPAARFYKIKPASIIIIHDDSDIELGKGKLSFNKSSAGHKGVESTIRALKTQSFWRFRIGIQKKKRVEAEKLVLQKFTPDEKRMLSKVMRKTEEALETILKDGPQAAMNTYNA